MVKANKPAEKMTTQELVVLSAKDLDLNEEQRLKCYNDEYAQYVRSLLLNWRQGTVACKGRSDVSFSNRKPWKQKGTGRARAGSARSPLWRHGGVIFGPQERTRTLKVTKAMRRNVGNTLLWDRLDSNRIVVLDWSPLEDKPKTAHAAQALHAAGLNGKQIVFFVSPHDRFTHASFANLPSVRMLLFDQWNAYDVSQGDVWMILKKDIDTFKNLVTSWT